MRHIKKRFLFLVPILLLSGCAGMNSQFDCPMKPGVMCKSLDQVNTMVDQGRLGTQAQEDASCPTCRRNDVPTIAFKNTGDFTTPYPGFGIQPGDPVRYGETVLRIWFAPYEDKDGNYYQPTTIYTVVKKGHWLGKPVSAITDEGDAA